MVAPASPQIVGRYGIYDRIASGGMASVHFGRLLGAAGFSRTVAVKRLHAHLAEDPQFLSTMIDEARLAARIHHPNVVPTLDVVAAHGELLVIMEYVRGESLARLLHGENTRARRVPSAIVSAVVIGALHGLHAAHEATSDRGAPLGIVHRDVSPQNILVGVDGVARVIDFGVAKAAGRLQTTSAGAVKGKVAYMAPEQLAAGDPRIARGEVTRAADVYAMGVVLWEMLAGKRLFMGDHSAQLILQVLLGAREAPSTYGRNVAPALDALVMRALALDPAERFSSAKEMAEALLRVVPPAFPTDVGAWVEDAAGDALARRGAQLAEIESDSDAIATPPPVGDRPALSVHDATTAITAPDAMPTIASQPSSLSLETPKPRPVPGARSPRAWVPVLLVGALGGAVLLACVAFGLGGVFRRSPFTHGAGPPEVAVVPPIGPEALAVAPGGPASRPAEESATAAPPATARAADAASPLPRASTAPAPESASGARSAAPARSHAKAHPPAKPAPFRFAQPD